MSLNDVRFNSNCVFSNNDRMNEDRYPISEVFENSLIGHTEGVTFNSKKLQDELVRLGWDFLSTKLLCN